MIIINNYVKFFITVHYLPDSRASLVQHIQMRNGCVSQVFIRNLSEASVHLNNSNSDCKRHNLKQSKHD